MYNLELHYDAMNDHFIEIEKTISWLDFQKSEACEKLDLAEMSLDQHLSDPKNRYTHKLIFQRKMDIIEAKHTISGIDEMIGLAYEELSSLAQKMSTMEKI